MYNFTTPVLLLVLLLVAYQALSSILKTRTYRAKAARNGCLDPPTIHSNDLLGISRLREGIKASKEDRNPQYVIKAMNEIGHDVHTVRLPIFNHEILVTRDPENVKAIFTSGDFDISIMRATAFMPLLGKGLFTSRGQAWKHSRALVRPAFAREEVANLCLVERHVQALLGGLSLDSDGWSTNSDLSPLFFNFSLDSVTELLYGRSVHSQITKGSITAGIDGQDFSYHLDAAKTYVDKRGSLGRLYWLLPMNKMKAHSASVHKVIDWLIAKRLEDLKYGEDLGNNEETRKFVLLDELSKESTNLLELRNETLHTLVAGRDTTGALIGWVFYLLARHPLVYSKLRSIIISQFPLSSNIHINIHSLKSCNYLQWVLHETIRFIAIVPMNERVALCDTVLPRGGGEDGQSPILVRKGIQVLMPLYAMQHRTDIWGDNAEQFVPERWDGRKTGWEWVPFGAGARKCLGQQFALTEAAYLIVRLLQVFDKCENLEGDADIKLHTAIENRSGTGVQVRFHRAEEDP